MAPAALVTAEAAVEMSCSVSRGWYDVCLLWGGGSTGTPMKTAADAVKAPVEMAAVLAMAPVAMVAPVNMVMVAPAPVAMAAAAGAPVTMVTTVHVETVADSAEAPVEKAAAAPVETEVAVDVDKAEGRAYCLELTLPPSSHLSACLCHPVHLVHHL